MRTLSATLEAAQKKHIGELVAQAVIDDRHCGVFRPRWELLVEDSVADGPASVCMTYDGSFIRARTDPAAGTLSVQRITDPASAAQWTAWTLLESDVAAASQIALAWDGITIQALFWVAGDLRTIKLRQSSDNGQTWSAAATVTTLAAGHACRSLAASLNAGNGVLYCLYADEEAGEALVYSTTRDESGGSWSTPQGWGRDAASALCGLAVDGVGDELRVTAGLNHCLCTFAVPPGSLGNWPQPTEALRADGARISYGWPHIALSFDPDYHIFCTMSDALAGTVRLNHVIAPNWQASMFPRPYAVTAAYGACAVGDLTYHYLCTARAVYRAKRWLADSSQRVAVSADVHALHCEEYLHRPGRLVLTLRNDDGRYATVGETGAYQAIKPGSQVSLRLGYRTTAGDEVSYLRPYWITGVAHQRRDGALRLLVSATDGWGILDRTRAGQAFTWTEETILSILTSLLAGLGFQVTDDESACWLRPVTRFAVNPGVALGSAVRSLLRMAGGGLIFRSDAVWEEHWPSAVAHLAVPSGTSAYSYGGDHAILAAHYGMVEQEVTHVVALGQGQVSGEALDWDAIELGNEDRVALVVDRRLATAGEAETRASEYLAAAQQATANGHIIVAPNVGQEILDAITINDPGAGMDDVRLVVANAITLDRDKGVFEQTLELASAEC